MGSVVMSPQRHGQHCDATTTSWAASLCHCNIMGSIVTSPQRHGQHCDITTMSWAASRRHHNIMGSVTTSPQCHGQCRDITTMSWAALRQHHNVMGRAATLLWHHQSAMMLFGWQWSRLLRVCPFIIYINQMISITQISRMLGIIWVLAYYLTTSVTASTLLIASVSRSQSARLTSPGRQH